MILQSLTAAAGIFGALALWISIDLWARRSGLAKSYECSEDETHCHQCELADNCTQRHSH